MPEYTIDPEKVTSSLTGRVFIASEPIVAGQAVYFDASENRVRLASNDDDATAAVVGISLNSAETGQPISILTSGVVEVDDGTFDSSGEVIVLGETPGSLMPASDLANDGSQYTTIVGVTGSDGDSFAINIFATAIANDDLTP